MDHQEGAACHLEEWAAWVKCNKRTKKKVTQKGNFSKEYLFSFFVIINFHHPLVHFLVSLGRFFISSSIFDNNDSATLLLYIRLSCFIKILYDFKMLIKPFPPEQIKLREQS